MLKLQLVRFGLLELDEKKVRLLIIVMCHVKSRCSTFTVAENKTKLPKE